MPFARRSILAAIVLSACSLVHAQTADEKAALAQFESNPKFKQAWNEGRQLRSEDKELDARDAFAKANKIAGGNCTPCLTRVYSLDMELKNYKDAIATAQQLVTLAPDPRDKSTAEAQQGNAMLLQAGDKPKPAQLDAIHAVLQAALTDRPKNQRALWDDAMVLAHMGKLDDAKAAFTTYENRAVATDPKRIRASHFAENPSLALQKMAPAFELKTLDGTTFNMDDNAGKVVLLDFWATWCGPCMESLPELQKIAKEFAGQPLVMLSISQDDDGPRWKEFVAAHNMTWLQFRDKTGRISALFDFKGIPHYYTIDSDGVLTAEMMGSDSNVEGKLKKLVKRAAEAKPPAD